MTHTLISLLGRGNPDRGKRYQTTTYDFGDGCLEKAEFFGLALTKTLRPDRLLLLGTTASMWDVLLCSLELDKADDDLLSLIEAANADRTTQAQLDDLAPTVSDRLGLPVQLQLIPYGCDLTEQVDILQSMANRLAEGDHVSLDLTHGLRHLPMLALVSAMYLQVAARVQVAGLYYGALDMRKNDITPVMRLDGLLHIADWLGALRAFDKDGDYGIFTTLLQAQGFSKEGAHLCKEAAFFERTTRIGQARGSLSRFQVMLDKQPLTGIGRLFEPTLRQRTAWHQQSNYYQRQRAQALFNLDQGDYLRAAIFAYEAFITRLVRERGDNPENYQHREQAEQAYKAASRQLDEYDDYRLLHDLRNQLAHGNASPRREVQQALANEQNLSDTLAKLITDLLPYQ